MRAREFLLEKKAEPAAPVNQPNTVAGDPNSDPLYGLKLAIASKIKDLPADEKTAKALREIEDLLSYVNAGGRKGSIEAEIQAIQDKDVHRARALLAKYIYSLDMNPAQFNDLFKRWKNDELINRDLLLSPGKHTIGEIINGYDDPKNPAIKELADDLAQVAALGQGKGEFLLSVLSKSITKKQKGDLEINGLTIEVKTLDAGAGRFYDQEVRPAPEYASSVINFKKTWAQDISAVFGKVAGTGLKLVDMITLADNMDPARKPEYWKSVEDVLSNIFPGMDISKIVNAMQVGNIGMAKQAYAVTNLDYYRGIKVDDAGILFIDLTSKPSSMVFFNDAAGLIKGGLRLHANTVYPVTNDPRNAYPQMRIIPTKHGGGDAGETPTPVVKAPAPTAKTPAVTPKAPPAMKATKTPVKPAPAPSAGAQNQNIALKTSKIPMGSQPATEV